MNFGFTRAHGYVIEKGYIGGCGSKEEAIRKIENGECSDIIDEYDADELTVGYKMVEIWELE